jgi:hypothetical protein
MLLQQSSKGIAYCVGHGLIIGQVDVTLSVAIDHVVICMIRATLDRLFHEASVVGEKKHTSAVSWLWF